MMRCACLAFTVLALAVSSITASALAGPPKPQLLVSVSASGGLCPQSMCRWSGRITTTTISATDRIPRRLTAAERRALEAAIARLRPAALPKFAGTCPIAYDGQEFAYRFQGRRELRSCTYDLRRVTAVQLTDRLLRSLKPR